MASSRLQKVTELVIVQIRRLKGNILAEEE